MCWLINKPISDTDKFLEVDEEGEKWRVNWAAVVVEPVWLELWADTMGQKEGCWCKPLLLPGWRWDHLHVQDKGKSQMIFHQVYVWESCLARLGIMKPGQQSQRSWEAIQWPGWEMSVS